MAEIIEFNKDKKISKEKVAEYSNFLGEISNENLGAIEALGALLDLDDEDFEVLAPGIIFGFQQSINNPNDRLVLVQSLLANGNTISELLDSFGELDRSLDNIEGLSSLKKDFLKQIYGSIINAITETQGIAKKYIQIPVELCNENAKMPQYANVTDSGMDVYALEDYDIAPGETKLIPTGIKLALPPGYEIQVRPKSGRALKTKLRIANTPGTIDAGYRDEIKIIVENIEPPIKDVSYHYDDSTFPPKLVIDSILHGSSYSIGQGEKFCQLVLCEVPKAALYRVESVGEIGENRGGGFGSTGLK